MKQTSVLFTSFLSLSVLAESPYAFKNRLVSVHRADRRDLSAVVEVFQKSFAAH